MHKKSKTAPFWCMDFFVVIIILLWTWTIWHQLIWDDGYSGGVYCVGDWRFCFLWKKTDTNPPKLAAFWWHCNAHNSKMVSAISTLSAPQVPLVRSIYFKYKRKEKKNTSTNKTTYLRGDRHNDQWTPEKERASE